MQVYRGDIVSFIHKGKKHKILVGRCRIKRSKNHAPTETAIGVSLTSEKESVIEVPVHMCKMHERAKDQETVSRAGRLLCEAEQTIKQNKAARQGRRMMRNRDVMEERGLDLAALPAGAIIEVQFKNVGWLRCRFVGLTKTNRIRFREPTLGGYSSKVRYAWPDWVRIPKKERK